MVDLPEMPSSTMNGSPPAQIEKAREPLRKRIWMPLLVVPYILGIMWHAVHPSISVFTGRLRPRLLYIDENSLDTSLLSISASYEIIKESKKLPGLEGSLCLALGGIGGNSLSCHRMGSVEIAQILPTSAAVTPTNEAIAIVIPSIDNWAGNQFDASIRQLIQRLASPSATPWLAKTILIVSPVKTDNYTLSLTDTVNAFLELCTGTRYPGKSNSPRIRLPREFFPGTMIRSLLVVNCNATLDEGVSNNFIILSQGRRGVLPNMDLVAATTNTYSRAMFTRRTAEDPKDDLNAVMHPYKDVANAWIHAMKAYVPPQYHQWLSGLIHLILFEYTLLIGPVPPHAEALERGIDALTIQGHFHRKPVSSRARRYPRGQGETLAIYSAEMVRMLEPLIRALSNLHERLHHSTSLYLLISSQHFVKHEEYLVPNLLLLIPMVIRALTLVLFDMPAFHWDAARWSVSCMLFGLLWTSWGVSMFQHGRSTDLPGPLAFFHNSILECTIALAYLPMLLSSSLVSRSRGTSSATARSSVQLIACLVGVYIHVAIAFGHVSLAFPSALFWTPLIAFPSYRCVPEPRWRWLWRLSGMTLFVVTLPILFLVPHIVPTYTAYVKYAYLPLHMLTSTLWMSGLDDPVEQRK
jgi:GPI-anchor transamidase subunit GAA1